MKSYYSLFFLFILLLVPLASAQINQAPSWMSQDVYAEYKFNSTGVAFKNLTAITFQNGALATFRWQCIETSGNMATLNISVNFDGNSSFTVSNIVTHEVFLTNDTFVGLTFLWGPTNVQVNDTVILWNNPPEVFEGDISFSGTATTPQGTEKIYNMFANGTIAGKYAHIDRLYDLDTGVFVDGYLADDIVFSILGFNYLGGQGQLTFSNTNINLGPSEQTPTSYNVLIILLVSIISLSLLFAVIYANRRSSRKSQRR